MWKKWQIGHLQKYFEVAWFLVQGSKRFKSSGGGGPTRGVGCLTSVTFFKRPPLNYWLSKTRFCAISLLLGFQSVTCSSHSLLLLLAKTKTMLWMGGYFKRKNPSSWPIYINRTPTGLDSTLHNTIVVSTGADWPTAPPTLTSKWANCGFRCCCSLNNTCTKGIFFQDDF